MDDKKPDKIAVAYDDVMDFMREKIVNSNCQSCNENQWSLEGANENEDIQLLIYRRAANGSMTSGIPCYALICNSCGYVKTYAKYAVALWKGGEQKTGGDSE